MIRIHLLERAVDEMVQRVLVIQPHLLHVVRRRRRRGGVELRHRRHADAPMLGQIRDAAGVQLLHGVGEHRLLRRHGGAHVEDALNLVRRHDAVVFVLKRPAQNPAVRGLPADLRFERAEELALDAGIERVHVVHQVGHGIRVNHRQQRQVRHLRAPLAQSAEAPARNALRRPRNRHLLPLGAVLGDQVRRDERVIVRAAALAPHVVAPGRRRQPAVRSELREQPLAPRHRSHVPGQCRRVAEARVKHRIACRRDQPPIPIPLFHPVIPGRGFVPSRPAHPAPLVVAFRLRMPLQPQRLGRVRRAQIVVRPHLAGPRRLDALAVLIDQRRIGL